MRIHQHIKDVLLERKKKGIKPVISLLMFSFSVFVIACVCVCVKFLFPRFLVSVKSPHLQSLTLRRAYYFNPKGI